MKLRDKIIKTIEIMSDGQLKILDDVLKKLNEMKSWKEAEADLFQAEIDRIEIGSTTDTTSDEENPDYSKWITKGYPT